MIQDSILFQLMQRILFLEKNMIFCKRVNLVYVAFYLQSRIATLQKYNISQNKFAQSYYRPKTLPGLF